MMGDSALNLMVMRKEGVAEVVGCMTLETDSHNQP